MRRPFLPVALIAAGLLGGPFAVPATAGAVPAAIAAGATAGEPLYAFNTGLVLTVGQHAGRGASVRVVADAGTAGQRWLFGRRGTISPAENGKLCLDVPVIKHHLSRRLELWPCSGTPEQRFARSSPSSHSPVLFLALLAARRKLCLSFPAVGLSTEITVDGTQASLAGCADSVADAFSTTNLQGTVASISLPDWQRALNANEGSIPGTAVTASDAGLQLGQQWESDPSGSYATLSPVYNTALCLTVSGSPRPRSPLVMATCNGSAAQQFIGIDVLSGSPAWYYLVSAGARFCVGSQALKAARKSAFPTRSVVLQGCSGKSDGQMWFASLNVPSTMAYQFQQFYTIPSDWSGLVPAIATSGGGSGSLAALAELPTAAQVWTDVDPATMTAGNSDGSISIRPLYDLALCLTVPAAAYSAGVQLQAQTCNGAPDQEFTRQDSGYNGGAADVFSPEADASLCFSYSGNLGSGDKVELAACNGQIEQAWEGWDAWYGWAG